MFKHHSQRDRTIELLLKTSQYETRPRWAFDAEVAWNRFCTLYPDLAKKLEKALIEGAGVIDMLTADMVRREDTVRVLARAGGRAEAESQALYFIYDHILYGKALEEKREGLD